MRIGDGQGIATQRSPRDELGRGSSREDMQRSSREDVSRSLRDDDGRGSGQQDDLRRRMEERRRQEAEGILKRQQEADAAARAVASGAPPTTSANASIRPEAQGPKPLGLSASYPSLPPPVSSSQQSAMHYQEQEGIARRQREADLAARSSRLQGQGYGSNPVSIPQQPHHSSSAPNFSSSRQSASGYDQEERARKQRAAEAAARAALDPNTTLRGKVSTASASSSASSNWTAPNNPPLTANNSSSSVMPAPTAVSSAQYAFLESHHKSGIPIMPLESPTKYDDDSSTDASVADEPSSSPSVLLGARGGHHSRQAADSTPTRMPRRTYVPTSSRSSTLFDL
ncbi:hypothetical protein JAAARDRAFT_294403 [Jaapia argillacea MUCL 33604]|uniref:Uncharacterized protein n=1 Tax=Jaapia argillacea MUCL 33604 TaxID=933084 RepID=A0A067Q1Q5_9AGAM|nr:hypothetical protein JAAARDRAFT_294403 [Jaapia argillacea MUCL 33604]